MALTSTVSFLVFATVLLEVAIRKSDLFSPARIFVLAHSLSLGVAMLGFEPTMTPFQPTTWIVYLGGGLAFLMGCALPGLVLPVGEPSMQSPYDKPYNWTIHNFTAVAVLLFSIFGLVAAMMGSGSLPALAEKKAEALNDFMKQSGYFLFAFSFSGIALAMVFVSNFLSKRKWYLRLNTWMIALTVLIFTLALSRVAMMFFVFFAMVFYHNAVRPLRLARIMAVILVCFATVMATGYLKAHELEDKTVFKRDEVVKLALKIPYMYLANNFWNLDHAVNEENHREIHPPTYGFTMIEGFLDQPALGGLGGHYRQDTHIDDQFNRRAIKTRGWNTFTYHWTLYKDFGFPGVVIGSLLIGMMVGLLYLRVRSSPSIRNTTVYAFIAFFVANSVFGFLTESPTYAAGLLFVMAATTLASRIAPGNDAPHPTPAS